MKCTECGASGYGLHHSASCKYLNVDIYKKCEQLQAELATPPKEKKIEVVIKHYRACANDMYIDEWPSHTNFIGFEYEDGLRSMVPRACRDNRESGPALIPKYVILAE